LPGCNRYKHTWELYISNVINVHIVSGSPINSKIHRTAIAMRKIRENLNDMKKRAVLGVIDEVTCRTHGAIK